MKKNLIFIAIIAIIIIGGALIYQNLGKKPEILPEEKISMSEKTLGGKSIAIIISFRDFRDEEYFTPREILEKAGAKITIVSNSLGKATGADGGEVEVNFLISNLKVEDFDAVVFIGGPGCLENLDNENSCEIARETVSQNKILASICISSVILAKAGVLEGKKATVWRSPMDKSAVNILKENGAIYQDEAVVTDGEIITANGPAAAKKFGEAIIEVLMLR